MIIHPAATAAFLDTTFDVFDLNGVRWVTALQIATALQLTPTSLRSLYKRHRSEFTREMTEIITVKTGTRGAQQTRVFSPRGAARIAMLARAVLRYRRLGLSVDEVCRLLAISPATVGWVSQRLRAAGLLEPRHG